MHRLLSDIDEIVEARLEEIFEAVHKELKKAGCAGQLPSGVVLAGGAAQLKGIVEYAKKSLGLAAKLGTASGYGGVAEHLDEPQFAAAVGLMLMDSEGAASHKQSSQQGSSPFGAVKQAGGGFLAGLLGRFKT